MITDQSIYFSRAFALPNKGLSNYFARVREGTSDILETHFYEGVPMDKVLGEWMSYLATHLKRQWPGMFRFEEDLAAKVGPMSTMAPLSERMKDIGHYFEDIYLPQEPLSKSAISAVLTWTGKPGLKLRNYTSTVQRMKVNTNSGCPFFTNRKSVIGDSWPIDVFYDSPYDIEMHLSDGEFYKTCAILGHRGQEGGPEPEDQKQRVVWMFPFSINICELSAYQVLIEYMQSGKFPRQAAWAGNDAVDLEVTALFNTKDKSDLVMCTDFTKFDQHYNPVMQRASLEILDALFTPCDRYDWWRSTIFPIKYNIPMAYDYGKIWFGPHGMGSGSGGTNTDETLGHKALQFDAAQRKGQRLNRHSQCQGDDGMLSYHGLDPRDVVDSYRSHGLEMNESKQSVSSEECTYLRRYYHERYRPDGLMRGVYSTCRALGRLRYHEREWPFGWNRYMMCIRVMAILENCKYHPCREAFVDYVIEGDPMRVGLDDPKFIDAPEQYINEGMINSVENSLPYNLTHSREWEMEGGVAGIRNWWSYNYLKSKLK